MIEKLSCNRHFHIKCFNYNVQLITTLNNNNKKTISHIITRNKFLIKYYTQSVVQ